MFSGAQWVPLLLLQQIAPDPERLPPVGAAVRQDRLPFGAQVVLELLELGRRRALQLHVVQPFQDEGGLLAIGREQGIERILGLVEVAQRLGPGSGRKGRAHVHNNLENRHLLVCGNQLLLLSYSKPMQIACSMNWEENLKRMSFVTLPVRDSIIQDFKISPQFMSFNIGHI